jgi:hypothetical protein
MKNGRYAPRIPEQVRQPNQMGMFERKVFWRFHQENFATLVLLQGITIKAYAELYKLDLRRAYVKFQPLGVAALRRKFWVQHRHCFQTQHQTNGISVNEYIQANKLHHKTAALELHRRPLNSKWAYHYRRYVQQFEERGITIEQYSRENGLNPSTTRRYLHKC